MTESLEDMIRKRIVSGLWDDPRKLSVDTCRSSDDQHRELPELSTEKPANSLSREYADEYEQKNNGAISPKDEALAEAKKSIISLWEKINIHLDNLCHFHNIPQHEDDEDDALDAKNKRPSLSVPAFRLEESLPILVSHSQTLAPEEIYASKKTPLKVPLLHIIHSRIFEISYLYMYTCRGVFLFTVF